jgi:hypothetical protein
MQVGEQAMPRTMLCAVTPKHHIYSLFKQMYLLTYMNLATPETAKNFAKDLSTLRQVGYP